MGLLYELPEGRVPKSSNVVSLLLVLCAAVTAATLGYDGNGLNILPSFEGYFHITTALQSLSTSAVYIGSILGGIAFPKLMSYTSRRSAMLWSSVITVFFAILQAASVHIAMFTIARIGVGAGCAGSAIAAPAYVAETFAYKYRGWGLGLVCDFYYVGALVAAGTTYGTATIESTWSWRIPSLLQGIWGLMCIGIVFFLPESPRWLIFQDRRREALKVLAQINSNGDEDDQLVLAQYQEIVDTIEFEKSVGKTIAVKELVKDRSARWRIALVISSGMATVVVGNQIASYYLGPMLTQAGIKDANTQLQINIILNAWCLVCALLGTYFAERSGRRTIALLATALLTLFLYLIGAFTKLYSGTTNTSGVYGTVACIFLFMGSYSFAWTPLAYLYPPEVLNYSMRAYGLGVNIVSMYGFGIVFTLAIPYALEALGWKTYVMNASWNLALIVYIYFYWVETKGKTLEEIDAIFDGEKHSGVPDMENMRTGKVHVDVISVVPKDVGA